jgi:hypothetical protein
MPTDELQEVERKKITLIDPTSPTCAAAQSRLSFGKVRITRQPGGAGVRREAAGRRGLDTSAPMTMRGSRHTSAWLALGTTSKRAD